MARLIAFVIFIAAGFFSAEAQTNVTTQATASVQVIILGTLHAGHKANTNYSLNVLQEIIVALKPAAILVELPPEIGGEPTVQNGRVTKKFSGNENTVANRSADSLGVNVIPYDREGRNEIYQQTHYFSRQEAAMKRLDNWADVQRRKEPDSIHVRALRLQSDSIESQGRFNRSAGPELLNSPSYDMLIATKHGVRHCILPKLLVASGERELSEELLFFADEWNERNRTMAHNIAGIARTFAGKRVVVLTGSEHRYYLRNLLARADELEPKEFYELTSLVGSARPTHRATNNTFNP